MYTSIVRPLLFRFKSDTIHESTIKWASKASQSRIGRKAARVCYNYQAPELEQKIMGMKFRNPVGLAAGFDKNGTLAPIIEALGFGFVEIGSVTATASAGNPKPRSFRLTKDLSLINRMGLNNDGAATIIKRLKNFDLSVPLGINIAKTHNPEIVGERALEDYVESFQVAKEAADYITLNVSCPNTREGKTFEDPETLAVLLSRLQLGKDVTLPPVFVKFSVDVSSELLPELIDVTRSHSVSGYVIANTSSGRSNLKTDKQTLDEIGSGGLSGQAIKQASSRMIREVYQLTRGKKLIIGVGGIFNTEDAIEKIRAGADLLQVYTGLIYKGPGLVREINKGIVRHLREQGADHIYQLRKSIR